MTFDVIVSLKGFNRHAFLAQDVSEASLGGILSQRMGTYDEDYGTTPRHQKHCAVTIHKHPTFWKNVLPAGSE